MSEGEVALNFGRYQNPSLLGQGGMGAVYKATDPQLDRFVAVKVLTHRDPKYVERFRREAQMLAKIMHPSIIQIYEIVGSDEGGEDPYIVMEYFEAKPLDALLKNGPMKQADVVSVMLRTAEGLKKAHANAVIHRDIKPANIMMSATGEVKILDFGIAKALDAKKDLTGATVLGTPYYMSPEQAMGQPIDARTDIYSLGITAFHLLTNQRPFEAKSKVDVMLMQVKSALPNIRPLCPGIDERLAKMIEKMCSKQPAARYQSCQELIEAIEQLPKSLGGRAAEDVGDETHRSLQKAVPAPSVPPARATLPATRRTAPPHAATPAPALRPPPVRVGPAAPNTPGRTPRNPLPPGQTPARSGGPGGRPDVRTLPPQRVSRQSRAWVGILAGVLGGALLAGGVFVFLNGRTVHAYRPPTQGWSHPGAPTLLPLKRVQAEGGYGNCVFTLKPVEPSANEPSIPHQSFHADEEINGRCFLPHQLGATKGGEVFQELWVDGQRRKQIVYDPALASDTDQVTIDVKQEFGALIAELKPGKAHLFDLWLYRVEEAANTEPLAVGEFTVRK